MVIRSGGDLDRRVVLQRQSELRRDDFNQPVIGWVNLLTVWARRRDATDQERFEAAEIDATLMSRFVIRSNSVTRTLTPVDRILHDDVAWNINGIKETVDGRARFLEITATRRVGPYAGSTDQDQGP